MEQALGSRYVIAERLGGGGMGTVYRAKRRDGGADRAVKVLRPELAEDPVVLTRFVQERTLMLQMRDEHLVAVEDMIVDGDTVAIVMELIGGGTLRRHANDTGPMAVPTALRMTRQVLAGLDVVHANGVVHRDVKPENVLLDRPEGAREPLAKVSDFGIARLTDSPRLTGTFNYIGTPHYCAPEIANGAAATPTVDVYAAGVMLYELVAGGVPFAGLPPFAVIRRQMEQALPRSPLIPDALWNVLARWMTADPAARPPDARQAMLEVDDLLKMMSTPTIALAGPLVPQQGEPLLSQPGQAPLLGTGLAGAGGQALAGSPQAPGLAPQQVAPDYLEVVHDRPPEEWPRHWPSQEGYDGTPPFGMPADPGDHPSIIPGMGPTPPPTQALTPPPQPAQPIPSTGEQAPAWSVDTGTHKIRRSKGIAIGAAAVVVLGGAVGGVVAVSSSGGGSKAGSSSIAAAPPVSATLHFPMQKFPELGVTEDRTWTVSGGKQPTLHGVLVFHTTRNVPAQIDEQLPKSLVAHASQVTFKPQPKVIQDDPVVEYTLAAQAGQTVTATYDVPISDTDVSLGAMQRWAAEQIADTGAAYRMTHTVESMSFQTNPVSVPAGSQVALQLVGKLANGTPAPTVAFGGATYKSASDAVATVSKLGVVTGVTQGTTIVTATLNNRTAAVYVNVTGLATEAPLESSAAPSTSAPPTTLVPTTVPPTTLVPTTVPPTTLPPTTLPPTTLPPTTLPPTTLPPTTLPPTSAPPSPPPSPPVSQVPVIASPVP